MVEVVMALIRRLFFLLFVPVCLAAAIVLSRSHDPLYCVQEWVFYKRFHRYDELITQAGGKYRVDPMLIKAVVWRESSFHPEKVGKSGERGLMQLMPAAAGEWAKAEKIQTFRLPDLHSPKTNIEAGTWYLKQALDRWTSKDDPVPFALAEYNAGRKRVDRWIRESNMGKGASAKDLVGSISFPGTRNYVEDITGRYRFYKMRGRM